MVISRPVLWLCSILLQSILTDHAHMLCREPQLPDLEPVLYLNGDGTGIVNNCCFPSAVAPSYAPAQAVRRICLLCSMRSAYVLLVCITVLAAEDMTRMLMRLAVSLMQSYGLLSYQMLLGSYPIRLLMWHACVPSLVLHS